MDNIQVWDGGGTMPPRALNQSQNGVRRGWWHIRSRSITDSIEPENNVLHVLIRYYDDGNIALPIWSLSSGGWYGCGTGIIQAYDTNHIVGLWKFHRDPPDLEKYPDYLKDAPQLVQEMGVLEESKITYGVLRTGHWFQRTVEKSKNKDSNTVIDTKEQISFYKRSRMPRWTHPWYPETSEPKPEQILQEFLDNNPDLDLDPSKMEQEHNPFLSLGLKL